MGQASRGREQAWRGRHHRVGSFVSSPDDHALLYTVAGSITVAPLLVDKLPYDANQD
jgi:hypothetical protein